jgi:hypothetical protein
MMSKIHIDRNKLSTQFGSIGLLSVFLFSLLISLPTFGVSAQSASPISPQKEAEIYQAIRFLTECSEKTGFEANNRSSAELNGGEVFSNSQGKNDLSVGFLLDPAEGSLRCLFKNGLSQIATEQQDVMHALQVLGVKGEDFFVKSGVYSPDNEGYKLECGKDNSCRSTKMRDFIRAKYPGLQIDGNMSHQAQYYTLKAAFLKQCADGGPKDTGGKEVKIVNDAGVVETKKFTLKQTGGDTVSTGFGIDSNDQEERYTCDEIISLMNGFADEAGKAQKDFIAKGGKATPESASANGTKPNCEQNAKVSMGWVLCGVLDAIDSILIGDHGLLAITENLLNVNSKQYDNSQLKQSWSYFKNIATFLLILIGLVMIIGQAVSKE